MPRELCQRHTPRTDGHSVSRPCAYRYVPIGPQSPQTGRYASQAGVFNGNATRGRRVCGLLRPRCCTELRTEQATGLRHAEECALRRLSRGRTAMEPPSTDSVCCAAIRMRGRIASPEDVPERPTRCLTISAPIASALVGSGSSKVVSRRVV